MSKEIWLWIALIAVAFLYRWAGKTIVSKPREYYPLIFLKFPLLAAVMVVVPLAGLAAVAVAGFLFTSNGWWYLLAVAGVFFGFAVRPDALSRGTDSTGGNIDPMQEMLEEQRKNFSVDMAQSIRATVASGDLAGFRALIRHLPDMNERVTPENWTLLHLLAAQGKDTKPVHAVMADDLLKAGADVNCRTVLGWTPIHMIAAQGQKEACELARVLVAYRSDLSAVDKMGLDWRMHWQHGREIRTILEEASVERRTI